jgi:hypothetical protein
MCFVRRPKVQTWLERRTDVELLVAAGVLGAVSLQWRHPLLAILPRIRAAISLLLMAIAMIASVTFLAAQAWRMSPWRAQRPER